MTRNKNILFLMYLNRAWDEPPLGFTRKRMILALGKELGNRGCAVLCVDRPFFLVPDVLTQPAALAGRHSLSEVGDNVFLFRPWAPVHYLLSDTRKPLRAINRAMLGAQVRQILKRLGNAPRISWVFHPFQSQCLGLAGELLSAYECYDDYASMSSMKKASGIEYAERKLLERVDVVFTTSQTLFEAKHAGSPNTFLVPNGVDYELFSKAASGDITPAKDVASVPAPRIGFIGKINQNVDFSLLSFLAESIPNASFVLVGPNDGSVQFQSDAAFSRTRNLQNISFLGPQEYEFLPSYLKAFDVCIMPHQCNEVMRSVYPLKVNEYLAAGKPVVSTNFGNLDEFRGVVHITDTKEEFLACIEKALKENTLELVAKRQAVAKSNSWEVRAKDYADIIEERLENSVARL